MINCIRAYLEIKEIGGLLMTQEVRLWEITDRDTLKEINQSKLNLELTFRTLDL